jgi:hypothetical protein
MTLCFWSQVEDVKQDVKKTNTEETDWIKAVVPTVGPPGAPGALGPPGFNGKAGQTGIQGTKGSRGKPGFFGPRGKWLPKCGVFVPSCSLKLHSHAHEQVQQALPDPWDRRERPGQAASEVCSSTPLFSRVRFSERGASSRASFRSDGWDRSFPTRRSESHLTRFGSLYIIPHTRRIISHRKPARQHPKCSARPP